jgi:CPA2 family monovalent cation:H+ antiporter-2
MVSMAGIMLMIAALSASILPPKGLLVLVLIIAITLTAIFWRWFIQLHSRLQIMFMDRFEKDNKKI